MTDRDTTRLPPPQPLVTDRRRFLLAGGAVGGAFVAGRVTDSPRSTEEGPERVPFHGQQQAGIATPQQRFLQFAAFDVTADSPSELAALMRDWTNGAARLCSGREASSASQTDPGEAVGLGPARLTITLGLGRSLFERDGADRFGLRRRTPPALADLPTLPGDELDPQRSGGDLGIQACADDPQVAFHAIHTLALAAHGVATIRWSQAGFLPSVRASEAPRNLMGFKDGTRNIDPSDTGAMGDHVWIPPTEGRGWLAGGTYLVARRIRMLLDVWDGLPTARQEATIGRRKATGAPLGNRDEHDMPDLGAGSGEAPTIPVDAHVRLAAPESNNGIRLLRRSYSYSDGVDPDTGQLDAGLFFISFQRDPLRQFAPIQRRLGESDALRKHLSHTSSAVFACPPGTPGRGFIADGLFA